MNGGKLIIEVETNTKKFDKQIEETQMKLWKLEETGRELREALKTAKTPEELEAIQEEIVKTDAQVEKLKNHLTDLYNKRKGKSDGFGFKDGLKDLKKFALGLIGVRGLYSMVRRASSAWLSQDEELSKKFQNFWIGLGSALKPILEWLADIMYKLLGYINVFVKAFTNNRVDLIATANAQAIKKQANAMKELKNQSYGFDELNIQQTNDTSSSPSGIIPDIKLDPGIEKFVKNLGTILGDIWGHLEDILKWCRDNLGEGGTILLAIAAVIGVKALVGGSGLLGVLAVVLAIIDGLKIIKDNMPDTGDYTEKVEPAYEKSDKDYQKSKKEGNITSTKDKIRNDFKTLEESLEILEQRTHDLTDQNLFTRIVNNAIGRNDQIGTQMKTQKKFSDETIKSLVKLAKQGDLSNDEITRLIGNIQDYYKIVKYEADEMGWDKSEELNKIKGYLTELGKGTNITVAIIDKASGTIKQIENGINGLNEEGAEPEVTLEDNNTVEKIDEIDGKMDKLNGKEAHPKIVLEGEDKTKAAIDKATKNLNEFAKKFGINLGTKAISGANPLTLAFNGLGDFIKFALNPFATGGVIHKSAVGSIVNNPGRGVYLGNGTISGEAGKEGVIPLTDPNAMTELGETIGRYITVNVTNVTKLDSKVIGRETKRVNNDMEFLRNGGGA